MQSQPSRRELIKILVLSGFSLMLPGCSNSENQQTNPPPIHPKSNLDQEKEDKLKRQEQKRLQREQDIEQALSSNHVVFVHRADKDYDTYNIGFNLRVPKQPSIIALCKNTQGVSEAIKYALAKNLSVAVKSGGHSFEGFSSINDGMQINLSLMNSISWLENNRVNIQPACLLQNIYDELLPKKRILPAGSCGTVGIGGLTLGGGYGFFSRKHGLTCDHLEHATFVDGHGNIHQVSDKDDLMWALKGGGNGNFGIVTNFIFKTHPAPKHFTRYRFKAYNLDKTRAKELLQAYFKYSATLPTSCFAAFVLNYKTLVLLITNYESPTPELNQMIKAFEKLTDKTDKGSPRPLAKSLKTYYGIDHPIPFKNASAGYYNSYEDIASSIDDVLDTLFAKRGLIYQINTLGGNINKTEFENNSCYPHRKMPYLSELQAYWENGQKHHILLENFSKIQNILYTNGIRKQYRNYPNVEFKNWESSYYGDSNYKKLQVIKSKYDPQNIFNHQQTIRLT